MRFFGETLGFFFAFFFLDLLVFLAFNFVLSSFVSDSFSRCDRN